MRLLLLRHGAESSLDGHPRVALDSVVLHVARNSNEVARDAMTGDLGVLTTIEIGLLVVPAQPTCNVKNAIQRGCTCAILATSHWAERQPGIILQTGTVIYAVMVFMRMQLIM